MEVWSILLSSLGEGRTRRTSGWHAQPQKDFPGEKEKKFLSKYNQYMRLHILWFPFHRTEEDMQRHTCVLWSLRIWMSFSQKNKLIDSSELYEATQGVQELTHLQTFLNFLTDIYSLMCITHSLFSANTHSFLSLRSELSKWRAIVCWEWVFGSGPQSHTLIWNHWILQSRARYSLP